MSAGHREMANRVFRSPYFKTPAYEPIWGEADETIYPRPVQQRSAPPLGITYHNEEFTPKSEEIQTLVPNPELNMS